MFNLGFTLYAAARFYIDTRVSYSTMCAAPYFAAMMDDLKVDFIDEIAGTPEMAS
jgi:hypothetical protein